MARQLVDARERLELQLAQSVCHDQPPYHALELEGDVDGPVTKKSSQFRI
ncbi:MAG TPA: hypothetical protein VHX13_13205 [Acidobacteriaceae bacterium]|nr:hypothetical protein [Acidobacteriaceae bacterium]